MRKPFSAVRHTVDFLFVLSLLGFFALSALLVMLFGANTYENLVAQSEGLYETGTSLSYIREKIHANGSAQDISIAQREGTDVLVLSDSVGERRVHTWIYFLDGTLYELYQPADDQLPLSSGQEILQLEDFTMEQLSDTLFYFTAVGSNHKGSSLYVTVNTDTKEAL